MFSDCMCLICAFLRSLPFVHTASPAPVISNLFDTSVTTTSALQSPTFYVDDKPLAQKLNMQYVGTFLIYVAKKAGGGEEHPYKIVKLEFAFTAVDEKQA
ncbi:hypothetical protein EON63_15540 [archaeon]|nr:MAG: hypothetical protein EON63_15540 [archaeon]